MHRPIPSLLLGSAVLFLFVSAAAAQDQTTPPKSMSITRQWVNYHPLIASPYDYGDIEYARGIGYSLNDIATLYIIARQSGTPFRRLVDEHQSGNSFDELADTNHVPVSSFSLLDEERDQLDSYMVAVEASGAHPTTAPPASESGYNVGRIGQEETWAGPLATVTTTVTEGAADIVADSSDLHVFSRLIRKANLTETINNMGAVTIFAPTDDAFSRLSSSEWNRLKDPEALKNLVLNHILPYRIDNSTIVQLTTHTLPPTLEGAHLSIDQDNSGTLIVGGAKVTRPNVLAANGVVHEIDTVLVPSD